MTSTSATQLDPEMQQYIQQVWGAATGAAKAAGTPVGADPNSLDAADFYRRMLPGGQQGFAALNGDPAAMAGFMNPYTSNVIDQLKSQYGDLTARTNKAVDDYATQAGAFGGSRHDVARGVALAQEQKDQGSQIAGLLDQGYNDATSRAASAASAGMGAASSLDDFGRYMRGVDIENQMRPLEILRGTLQGLPYGQTTTTTQPWYRNPAAGAMGGALTGSQIGSDFGPWGTGIGAGIGGLLGLFG